MGKNNISVHAVSTLSRLKAAGILVRQWIITNLCFNTQPPEGGWPTQTGAFKHDTCFNTQPPEGGWDGLTLCLLLKKVSTLSRLKAAGYSIRIGIGLSSGFNTQPPEGGWKPLLPIQCWIKWFQHSAA